MQSYISLCLFLGRICLLFVNLFTPMQVNKFSITFIAFLFDKQLNYVFFIVCDNNH